MAILKYLSPERQMQLSQITPKNMKPIFCHNCGEKGHKSTFCQKDKIDK